MLTLDPGSIQVNTAGYKNYSRTVSASRTYPNLSDADTALIPKTITENGCSLTLTDVQWQNAATDYQDGYDLAMRYTAAGCDEQWDCNRKDSHRIYCNSKLHW